MHTLRLLRTALWLRLNHNAIFIISRLLAALNRMGSSLACEYTAMAGRCCFQWLVAGSPQQGRRHRFKALIGCRQRASYHTTFALLLGASLGLCWDAIESVTMDLSNTDQGARGKCQGNLCCGQVPEGAWTLQSTA
jgi:hypothetical protein